MSNQKFRYLTGSQTIKNGKSWGCSILTGLFLTVVLSGCWVQFGPVVKNELLVIKAGVPVEILQNKTLRGRVISEGSKDGTIKEVEQDIGGWVAMPPEHWELIQDEIKRLRAKCGEPERRK